MTADIAVGTVGLPQVGNLLKKPTYLVRLTEGKKVLNFLSLDKPSFEGGFIQAKGCFVEEDDLTKSVEKDQVVEMYFPNHVILSIKNLAYKSK